MTIEAKVQAASLWSLAASVGIAILNAIEDNSHILGALPPLAQFVILSAVPPTLVFLSAYVAAHTPRPDLYNYGPPLEPHLPGPPPVAYEQWDEEPYYEPAPAPAPVPPRPRYQPQYDTTEWAPVPPRPASGQSRRRPPARHQSAP
jgi:hypothetical protein